jgi:hypothetical protein
MYMTVYTDPPQLIKIEYRIPTVLSNKAFYMKIPENQSHHEHLAEDFTFLEE